jgi:hypothetical protein
VQYVAHAPGSSDCPPAKLTFIALWPGFRLRTTLDVSAITLACAAASAHAQVLHVFAGSPDGAAPTRRRQRDLQFQRL